MPGMTITAATVPLASGISADWFEQLYRSSAADLYGYVASLLRDRGAAEDVTALAFERAFRRRRLFNARRGSPRAWLFGIARNAALDELRRRGRTCALDEKSATRGQESYEEQERVATQATVRVALQGLQTKDRELILLKFHGQLSNAELARLIGTTESNVGTKLHRALNRLREACNESA